jgi:hypothetical protein
VCNTLGIGAVYVHGIYKGRCLQSHLDYETCMSGQVTVILDAWCALGGLPPKPPGFQDVYERMFDKPGWWV